MSTSSGEVHRPFIDVAPTGPERLFDEDKVKQLFTKIKAINESAVALQA